MPEQHIKFQNNQQQIRILLHDSASCNHCGPGRLWSDIPFTWDI